MKYCFICFIIFYTVVFLLHFIYSYFSLAHYIFLTNLNSSLNNILCCIYDKYFSLLNEEEWYRYTLCMLLSISLIKMVFIQAGFLYVKNVFFFKEYTIFKWYRKHTVPYRFFKWFSYKWISYIEMYSFLRNTPFFLSLLFTPMLIIK